MPRKNEWSARIGTGARKSCVPGRGSEVVLIHAVPAYTERSARLGGKNA
jgi:hypothetical protein